MSLNIAFIGVEFIRERYPISKAIDDRQITPLIKLAQDKYILPALGSGLYNRLQQGKQAANLTNDEKTLLNIYISDTLLWFTLSEMVTLTSYQFFSKGMLQKSAEESQNPSKGTFELLERKFTSNAEFYKQRLVDYLIENRNLFYTYLNPGTGVDTIFPQEKAYTSPIYLGRGSYSRRQAIVRSGGANVSGENVITYVVSGNGDTAQFTLSVLAGKTILTASRSGLAKVVTTTEVSDTNYIQISNGVVYAPTGDAFQIGETFIITYK